MSSKLPAIPGNAPELVKRDPVIQNALKPSIRELLQAENGDALILAKIGEAFLQQHTINGAKTAEKYTDQDVTNVQRQVFEKLVRNFQNLSLHEILYAFKQGMSGEYGEPYYFSAMAVNHWLKSYDDKERKKSMREYNRALQKQADEIKPEPSETEQNQMRREIFERFACWITAIEDENKNAIMSGQFKKEHVPVPMHIPYWYQKLVDLNLMGEPSTEDKNRYYEKAIEQTRPGEHQKQEAIQKAKGWFVRDHVYKWIINDTPYRAYLLAKI